MPHEPSAPMESERPTTDEIVRSFVEHWGAMARLWGINSTMAELFAVMYIAGGDWSADDLQRRLRISRGNVSMNLRELLSWQVVHRIRLQGQRKEFYRAETNVWQLFKRIITERKRREVEPTLAVLGRTVERMRDVPEQSGMEGRAEALKRFFETINTLATRLVELDPDELQDVVGLIDQLRLDGG